jgi:hypothetical protein
MQPAGFSVFADNSKLSVEYISNNILHEFTGGMLGHLLKTWRDFGHQQLLVIIWSIGSLCLV